MIPLELIDLISKKINIQLLIDIFSKNNCIYFFNRKQIEKYLLKKNVQNLFINNIELCKITYKSVSTDNSPCINFIVYTSEKMFEKINQYFLRKANVYYYRSGFETIEITYDPLYDMIHNKFDTEKEKKLVGYFLDISNIDFSDNSGDNFTCEKYDKNYIFFASENSSFISINFLLGLGSNPKADWINNPINKIVNDHFIIKNKLENYIKKYPIQ